jgi:hypothetical protein
MPNHESLSRGMSMLLSARDITAMGGGRSIFLGWASTLLPARDITAMGGGQEVCEDMGAVAGVGQCSRHKGAIV